jgi:hypothetical protein
MSYVIDSTLLNDPVRILDVYPNFNYVWSLKLENTAYAGGNCLAVRRSSDGVVQNFGFDANGDLNTAAILTFIGANTGFVTTFYGQKGGINLTQPSGTNQPTIVTAGVLNTKNGRPIIRFAGNQYFQNLTVGLTRLDQRVQFVVFEETTAVDNAGVITYAPLTGNDFNQTNSGNLNTRKAGTGFNTQLTTGGTNVFVNIAGSTSPAGVCPHNVTTIRNSGAITFVNRNTSIENSAAHSYPASQFNTGGFYVGVSYRTSAVSLIRSLKGGVSSIVIANNNDYTNDTYVIAGSLINYWKI